MSVYYNTKGVAANVVQIDDNAPSANKAYSSAKAKELLDNLFAQIQSLKDANKSIRDIVGNYAELTAYPVQDLTVGDIINVLADETRDNANCYYRYDGDNTWTYIGDVASYYTKSTFNAKLNKKQWVLVSGQNIKTVGGQSILGNGDLPLDVDSTTFYPVGAIWQTATNFNPADLFGGAWELIENRSLLGAGNKYQLGAEGGEDEVTLTVNQIPSHNHEAYPHKHIIVAYSTPLANSSSTTFANSGCVAIPVARNVTSTYSDSNYDGIDLYKGSSRQFHGDVDWIPCYNGSTKITASVTLGTYASGNLVEYGEGQAHNNLPPVHKIKIWKRVG